MIFLRNDWRNKRRATKKRHRTTHQLLVAALFKDFYCAGWVVAKRARSRRITSTAWSLSRRCTA